MKLVKRDLIRSVSDCCGCGLQDAEVFVESLFQIMFDALRQGHEIEIRGFGAFKIRKREAHMAHDPRTMQKVHVDEKRVPYFRPGTELRRPLDLPAEEGDSQ